MKTWMVGALLGLATLVEVNRSAAQEIPAIPPGDDKIVAIKEGERAPFSGQLLDPPTALRWANWLGQYRLRLKADVELQKQLGDVRASYQEQLLVIEKERSAFILKDYMERFQAQQARIAVLEKELSAPPWYKSPWVALSVGVLGTTTAYIFVSR